MSYLGRPSAGDSPFAIGDRALHDTSSPQPPSQRNPTPRRSPQPGMPAQGGQLMATPSPYGSVSDEARRRYEERYAKKKQEAEQKAAEEERKKQEAANPPPQPQQQQQQQYGYGGPPRPPFSPNQPQSQQFGQPIGGYPAPPQQRGSGPLPRPPQNYPQNFQPQQPYQPQPPPQQTYQQQPQYGSPPMQQNPQNPRYSNPPAGYPGPPSSQGHTPQWSQNAVPPPAQQWQQPAASPPPAVQPPKQELEILFEQFDGSRTGQLNAYDLQKLLAKDATMEAREDCVKMLMNIFDTDRSGSINFQEFEGLYRYIKDWHAIFLRFDRDNSGLIDRKELHSALLGFGFSLPSEMVRKLEKRYAPPPKPGQPPMKGISFDRFLMACVTVKHYTEAFRRMDVRGEGRLTMDYNEFMEIVLDAPS